MFLSSLCRHDEGRKKKGEQSCWQRSASPARGPRCLGLVHHGRRSHLQIRRETLKERKWERKGERERERRRTAERKGEQATLTMHAQTHTHTHTRSCLDRKTKEAARTSHCCSSSGRSSLSTLIPPRMSANAHPFLFTSLFIWLLRVAIAANFHFSQTRV